MWILFLVAALDIQAVASSSAWLAVHDFLTSQRGYAEWRSMSYLLRQSRRQAIGRQQPMQVVPYKGEDCDSGEGWWSCPLDIEAESGPHLCLQQLSCIWSGSCRILVFEENGRTPGCQGHVTCVDQLTGKHYRAIISESGLIRESF